MRRSNVDLPLPLAPRSKHRDPFGRVRLRFRKVGGRVFGSYEKFRSITDMALASSYGGIVGRCLAREVPSGEDIIMLKYMCADNGSD